MKIRNFSKGQKKKEEILLNNLKIPPLCDCSGINFFFLLLNTRRCIHILAWWQFSVMQTACHLFVFDHLSWSSFENILCIKFWFLISLNQTRPITFYWNDNTNSVYFAWRIEYTQRKQIHITGPHRLLDEGDFV